MTANASLIPIKDLQIIYMESRVEHKIRKHLERRLEEDALN